MAKLLDKSLKFDFPSYYFNRLIVDITNIFEKCCKDLNTATTKHKNAVIVIQNSLPR